MRDNNISALEPPPQIVASTTVVSPAESPQTPRRNQPLIARFAKFGEGASTFLVIAALAGVAYWGHHAGWEIPKFGALLGETAPADDDWCAEHSVPKSICVECNESLLPRLKSAWCPQHGVHGCPFEHPELAQLNTTSVITSEDFARARRALDLKERAENNPRCKLHNRRLQFASEEAMHKMGIDIVPVGRGPIVETVTASGQIVFQQSRVAPLFTNVPGRVWLITDKAKSGALVQEGDVLALIEAVEVGKAKADFLQAFAQFDLKSKQLESITPSFNQGAIPLNRFREAEAAARQAHIQVVTAQQTLINLGLPVRLEELKKLTPEELAERLQFLGLPKELAGTLDPAVTTANLVPVKASRTGILKATKIVKGEVVDPAKTLFVVADTTRMWLLLNVPIEEVKYVRIRDASKGTPGQTVRFRADGSTQDVAGELVWKSTEVDEKTRTVPFRAELSNPDGLLLANSYGKGQIVLREEKSAILVPSEAVHWDGDCHIVFVRDKNFLDEGGKKVFHVRSVRPGVTNGRDTEIIAGLLPGEVVATRNSASLREELFKSSVGEGCSCGH